MKRRKEAKTIDRECLVCHRAFKAKRKSRKTCSDRCRHLLWAKGQLGFRVVR